MVLQDVDTAADSFTDNPSPSDNDAYTSSAPSGRYFDDSNLPRPLPVIGALQGFSNQMVRHKTETTLKVAEMRLHRPLTGEEAQAMAGHLYKLEQRKSYICALGTSVGLYRWYTTWDRFRYPFYTPKPESINREKFLWFKGEAKAMSARHSFRLLVWIFVAGELGRLAGHMIAQPAAAQDTYADPRLKQFVTDLKNATPSDPVQIIRENASRAREAASETRRADGKARWEPAVRKPAPTQADDDMSPTAGNDPWASSSGNSWGDPVFPSDSETNTQPRQQPTRPFGQPPRTPSRRDADADDEASPTGGMFQDEGQSQSKPGESAWDRLRKGGAPSMNGRQPPQQEQREGSSLGDSFTFVDGDEERRRERERAQREFDARIEQERQGKDFNENKRW